MPVNSENNDTNQPFLAISIPPLPESPEKRSRRGDDLQPVGEYAGIEPYYRVCEDVGAVQHQDQEDPDAFASEDWWWDQRQIRFLTGKAHIVLSALLMFIPFVWGAVLVCGGGILAFNYSHIATAELFPIIRFLVSLVVGLGWMALSCLVLIKTTPWVMGGFALLLRPFDKTLSKLLDRSLESGESSFNRQTGHLSFPLPGGRRLTAPFVEFDAYVERVIQQGGIFYRLIFVHRYTAKQFIQTSLGRIEPTMEEVVALWDMLQRYMDASQPLPDVPRLEPFRHLDPVTAEHDKKVGRNPRFWRDLDLEAWQQGEGAEWLRRQREYPWRKRTCRLTPQLGKLSMQEYREIRPQGAYPV